MSNVSLAKQTLDMVMSIGCSASSDDVGWNPIRPIFQERSGSREEHEEHGEEQREIIRGNTQEQVQSHIH